MFEAIPTGHPHLCCGFWCLRWTNTVMPLGICLFQLIHSNCGVRCLLVLYRVSKLWIQKAALFLGLYTRLQKHGLATTFIAVRVHRVCSGWELHSCPWLWNRSV